MNCDPIHIKSFKELKLLGSGKTSEVSLCEDKDGGLCAVKNFKKGIDLSIHNQEVQVLQELDHPNIVQMLSYDSDSITFEYAGHGDIFDYALIKPFEHKLARYYMIQLINVLDYIHQQNIFHRDIKLENLFLDENYQLKVGDFGLAGFTNDSGIRNCSPSPVTSQEDLSFSSSTDCSETNSNESNYLYEIVGTETYMAPELVNKQKYIGEQVDIFAFGVVLFNLIHGFPPYQKLANSSDPFYRLLIEKNTQRYWSVLEKKTKIINDDDFKDFINKLLDPNPSQRITLEEIKLHPWMHGDILSPEEIINQMQSRKLLISS